PPSPLFPYTTLFRSGLLTTIAWHRAAGTVYALDGGVFAAGSVVEWLVRLGLLADPASADALLASAPASSDEVTCVPALAGLAAPDRKSTRLNSSHDQ